MTLLSWAKCGVQHINPHRQSTLRINSARICAALCSECFFVALSSVRDKVEGFASFLLAFLLPHNQDSFNLVDHRQPECQSSVKGLWFLVQALTLEVYSWLVTSQACDGLRWRIAGIEGWMRLTGLVFWWPWIDSASQSCRKCSAGICLALNEAPGRGRNAVVLLLRSLCTLGDEVKWCLGVWCVKLIESNHPFLDISCSLAQSRRLPVFVLAMLFGLGCLAKKQHVLNFGDG